MKVGKRKKAELSQEQIDVGYTHCITCEGYGVIRYDSKGKPHPNLDIEFEHQKAFPYPVAKLPKNICPSCGGIGLLDWIEIVMGKRPSEGEGTIAISWPRQHGKTSFIQAQIQSEEFKVRMESIQSEFISKMSNKIKEYIDNQIFETIIFGETKDDK